MEHEVSLMFLDLYRQRTFSSIATVSRLILKFPDFIYVILVQDGNFELHYHRKALLAELTAYGTFNMTSFERGLKHAGLRVIQTTHGKVAIKKWTTKRGV